MSRDDFPSARGTRTWRRLRATTFHRHGLSWWGNLCALVRR